MPVTRSLRRVSICLALAALAAGCGHTPSKRNELACMARAMYFESNRSSPDGMLAVGTVVMNRVESDKFPDTVCGVVGQKKQFAPGVLSKPMKEGRSRELAERVAREVLRGKRHRGVGRKVMFFHTAGHSFPYNNMHYQVIAGGNAFYEKRTAKAGQRNRTQIEVAQATRPRRPEPVQVASRSPLPQQRPRRAPVAPVPAAPQPTLAMTPAPPLPASIEELIALNGG